ncbi:hypothetical protein [Spiroplasma eriocheiris]|uniref:Transmembrane protein n=1 Tax=Spiroplasma eriocheiris TaxID=315358 RepID=A0A0H3XK15_9MOLU|nr:hypothetical protein [Spiroplasma eriocheiris]AHF57756.1 hypothetical protein SPE_0628 [Spiroplasma eriocheiris CCTCC M 207170]AKM54206.1 hypothetical protein SERIO_v1c06360 [Spiroplasma eriocheiris]
MEIGFIIFFGVMGISVMITLILGIIQQVKIQNYKKVYRSFQTAINDQHQELTTPLQAITINYQLPVDEVCYAKEEVEVYILENTKEINHNSFYLYPPVKPEQPQYKIENLNGYINLKSPHRTRRYYGNLYVTNKRVLIDDIKTYKTIWLKDIIYCYPSIFNLNSAFEVGFFISTKDNIYKFLTKNVKISMILHKLLLQQQKLITTEKGS